MSSITEVTHSSSSYFFPFLSFFFFLVIGDTSIYKFYVVKFEVFLTLLQYIQANKLRNPLT